MASKHASFDWSDPLRLDAQLSDDPDTTAARACMVARAQGGGRLELERQQVAMSSARGSQLFGPAGALASERSPR